MKYYFICPSAVMSEDMNCGNQEKSILVWIKRNEQITLKKIRYGEGDKNIAREIKENIGLEISVPR